MVQMIGDLVFIAVVIRLILEAHRGQFGETVCLERRQGWKSVAVTYPLISDHGLIGDLQLAALVATDGTVDWSRAPGFDSPSVFAASLDKARGVASRFRARADDGDAADVPPGHRVAGDAPPVGIGSPRSPTSCRSINPALPPTAA